MTPRNWLRLILPAGLCVGFIPACMNSPQLARNGKPFVGDQEPAKYANAPNAQRPPRGSRLLPPPAPYWPAAEPNGHWPVAYWAIEEVVTLPGMHREPFARGGVESMALTLGPIAGRRDPLKNPPPTLVNAMPAKLEKVENPEPKLLAPPELVPLKLPASVTHESWLQIAIRKTREKQGEKTTAITKLVEPGKLESKPVETVKADSLLTLTNHVKEANLDKADPREIARYVEQLQSVLWSLRPKAALVMDKCCFCRQIRKFGEFEALPEKPVFQPGELVELYAEIRNVASQQHRSPRGDYLTHLRSTLDLRRPNGESVWSEPKRFDKPDATMTPQHDYFQHYRLQLPALPPGPYVLHLEILDVPTGRTATQRLEFAIGAAPKVERN